MPKKKAVALKIDFKINNGKLRIIDIGDALGADLSGFAKTLVEATLLKDLCESTGATLVTPFGELPRQCMHLKTVSFPLLLRQIPAERSYTELDDLPTHLECLLPYSEGGRLQSVISYLWGKKRENIVITPIALMAMEMHKLFWYLLMQKHQLPQDYKQVLYWCNDNSSEIDLEGITIQNGVFIKIADRSSGGGDEVYYAKDEKEIKERLHYLNQIYHSSTQPYKKHIFIIEPAYLTPKRYADKTYNVTGRAFITLSFDSETKAFGVKIAAANWIFPLESLQQEKTQNQMLSNIKHSICMHSLNAEELSFLAEEILEKYGEVFKAGFENDNLLDYCKEFPIVDSFFECLRPNAGYKLQLEASSLNQSEAVLKNLIHSLVFRDMIESLDNLLTQYSNTEVSVFFINQQSRENILPKLVNQICRLSFFEGYFKFLKTCNDFIEALPIVNKYLAKEANVKETLDFLIVKYLKLKNRTYEISDLNKALRQAAFVSDLSDLKLLIYTRRAEINACSPKSSQTALDFATKSENKTNIKAQCIQLLEEVGAKSGESISLGLKIQSL